MKNTKPLPFTNGYLDAKQGIDTFKPNDRWATFAQFKESMLLAANNCVDREYANGLRHAFKMIRYQGKDARDKQSPHTCPCCGKDGRLYLTDNKPPLAIIGCQDCDTAMDQDGKWVFYAGGIVITNKNATCKIQVDAN